MKKILLSAILFLSLSGSAMAQDKAKEAKPAVNSVVTSSEKETKAKGVRAGDIYAACKRYFINSFNSRENISRKATCNGYFFGVGGVLIALQAEKVPTKTCIPENISTHQIIKAFIDWGSKEESDLNIQSSKAVLKALRIQYPCNQL